MNEHRTVTRLCKPCGEQRTFDLTRIREQDGSGKIVLGSVSGACLTANHPMDDVNARLAWPG
jgi:hypothetical protein